MYLNVVLVIKPSDPIRTKLTRGPLHALSRMPLNNNNSSTPHNDTISIDKVLCSNVQISTTGIEKVLQETSKEVTLQHLKRIIMNGWLETQREHSNDLNMFWNYRDELSVEKQVFKGDMIAVPATLQHTILRHLHEEHMGLEKMLLRARSAVIWPGPTACVNNITKNCDRCTLTRSRTNTCS